MTIGLTAVTFSVVLGVLLGGSPGTTAVSRTPSSSV
jgi:hypothetical protein